MRQNSDDRGAETQERPGEAGHRQREDDSLTNDAMTDDDARTPDTAPTEQEPTWRSAEASGRRIAPPAPPA
ncbi:hypothetical protein GA0070624_4255 [Micromonospora rhizosphaerae]|uniref:Uncharacterized protein n=1 Tax=Micromonospora rhizosphaerae TaxID=568872 RepID=A0A1C6SPX6_9ACTN|nr:hypothetical protein GA0070624_4255 [Micromonospora rhizosphaerae]